jgi:hypothetical protein
MATTENALTRVELVARAKGLGPVLRERALEAERLRRLPDATVERCSFSTVSGNSIGRRRLSPSRRRRAGVVIEFRRLQHSPPRGLSRR